MRASLLPRSPLLLLAAALVALAVLFAPGAQPAQAQTTTVWSAMLTVKDRGAGTTFIGCDNAIAGAECSTTTVLTDDDFTYDSVDYEFVVIGEAGTALFFRLNKAIPAGLKSALTLNVGNNQFPLADATLTANDTQVFWSNTGLSWSVGATVQLSLTEAASSDATLSGLTASTSTSASGTFSALTLSPSTFAAATTAYTASVENDRTHVKITPTTSDSNATVEVGKGSSLTAVTSGSASGAIALSLGANAITVKVTAENGSTTKSYTVTVTRAAPIVSLSTSLVEAVEGASSAVVTLNIDPVLPTASSVRLVLNDPAAPGRLTDLPRTVALPAQTASVEVDLSANLPADNAVNGHNSGTALRLEAVNNAPYVVGSPQVLQLYVIDNDPPAAPLLFSTPGEEKLTAEWTRPAGPVQRYELRYKQKTAPDRAATTAGDPSTGWVTLTQPDVPWSLQNQSPRLREITGLAGGTAYHLQVRANDGHSGAGNGWGGWSRLKTDTAYRGYAPLWSSTLTVKDLGHLSGDGCNGQSQCSAQLSSSSSFTYGGGRYNVLAVRVVRGSLQILLDRPLSVNGGSLRLDVGGQQFRYKDASVSWGIERNEDAWRLTWHGTDLSWSDGDTVSLSLESNAPEPAIPAPHTDLHPVRVHYDEMRDGEPVYNFNSMRLASPNPSTIPGTFERRVELRAYIPGTFGSADPEQGKGIVTTTHVMLRVRAHLDSTLAWAIGNVYGVTGSFAAFDNGGYTPAIALNPASKWTYVYIRVTNGSQSATHLVAIDPPPRTYTVTPKARVAEGDEAALTLSLGSPAGAGGVSFTVSADYPDGGATAEDVGQIAATLTVPEGQQSARIIIPTVDDEAIEEDEERFTVRVAHTGEPAWAVDPDGTAAAVVTIEDNDEPPPPPEGPEPWDIKVVPGDGTLTVTWNIGSRDGVEDSEIWHVLRWSQEFGVWNNPRDPRAVGKNDGLSVDPGLTSYTITNLKNGVATGVFIRSMVGHRNNMSEREGNSSEWVRTKGEHTTPVAPPNDAPTVASAISDATIVDESGTHEASLSGVFADGDGDDLRVTASSSDESVATVSVSDDYSTLTVSAKSRGKANITVTASDGNGGEVSDTFAVTVNAPAQPEPVQPQPIESEPEQEPQLQQQAAQLPGTVINLTVEPRNTNITVSWEAPTEGGSITGYIAHIKPVGGGNGHTLTPNADKTTVKFRRLDRATEYLIWVRAVNEEGKGERTSIRTATK